MVLANYKGVSLLLTPIAPLGILQFLIERVIAQRIVQMELGLQRWIGRLSLG